MYDKKLDRRIKIVNTIWLVCFYLFLMLSCFIAGVMTDNWLDGRNQHNRVEQVTTGDIHWLCIDNDAYTRSCTVIDPMKQPNQ